MCLTCLHVWKRQSKLQMIVMLIAFCDRWSRASQYDGHWPVYLLYSLPIFALLRQEVYSHGSRSSCSPMRKLKKTFSNSKAFVQDPTVLSIFSSFTSSGMWGQSHDCIRLLLNKGKLTSNRTIESDLYDFRGFSVFFPWPNYIKNSNLTTHTEACIDYCYKSVLITYHGAKKSTIATWDTLR